MPMCLVGLVGSTTASCSFSSCVWISAAVRGRGWRTGPGPGPTLVLSLPARLDDEIMVADEICGEGREGGLPVLLTVLWFEGRMSRVEEELGIGGGGICSKDARRGWGDGGTELRSGIVKLRCRRRSLFLCR